MAAFLVDDSNNVYSLLPYTNSVTGQVKVKHDKEYLFFHTPSGEPEHGEVDELVMTAGGRCGTQPPLRGILAATIL